MSLYPKLPPTAPPEQVFRLEHIKSVEEFLNKEIKERDALQKRFTRCEKTANTVSTASTAVTVAASGSSIAAVITGVGLPVAATTAALGIGSAIVGTIATRLVKVFALKVKKHHDILITAQTILDGMTSIISKAISDGDITQEEFETILKEKQRYIQKKLEIRTKAKKIINQLSEEQRQEILEQGRQEGREEVAKKLINPSADTVN